MIRYDRESGAWMFVCIHSTALGPAGGGTRMRVYERPARRSRRRDAALAGDDVKMAVADADRGGGKAVLAVPELPTGEARRGSCSATESSSPRSEARTARRAT